MLIHHKHLTCRAEGITGKLVVYVAGHGGDVWFVKHDDSEDVGAYALSELEELPT